MLKNILNLGKALQKAEQKQIKGGKKSGHNHCASDDDCTATPGCYDNMAIRCITNECRIVLC